MQIVLFPTHYQSVCANLDFFSFSRISCVVVSFILEAKLMQITG